MSVALVIIFVGAMLFVSHVLSAIFERMGVPDVLLLLVIGLVIGPVTHVVTPGDFGQVGPVFTTIALVGILFESGLGLDFGALREAMMPALRLTILNFVATLAVVIPLGVFLVHLSAPESIVLGAIIAGTSSAVVIPLVGKIGLGRGTGTALLLESTFSDVICIVATLGILQALTSETVEVALLLGNSLAAFIVPLIVGAGFAVGWSATLHRIRRLENSISLTLAVVFVIYGFSELMGQSGAIAALSFGVMLGNIKTLKRTVLKRFDSIEPVHLNREERAFFSEVAFIIKTFFFVYVGVVMPLDDRQALLVGVVITAAMFIIRVPVVRATLRSGLTQRDASIAAVMVPKGLAAAVLAALPLQAGLAGGAAIQSVVYAVILISIVLTALLAFLVGRDLLRQPYAFVYRGLPMRLEVAETAQVPLPAASNLRGSAAGWVVTTLVEDGATEHDKAATRGAEGAVAEVNGVEGPICALPPHRDDKTVPAEMWAADNGDKTVVEDDEWERE